MTVTPSVTGYSPRRNVLDMVGGMTVQNGKLIIEPQLCPCYSLDELLAQCDATLELSHEGYAHRGVKS